VRIAFVHKRYATDGGTERVLESLARRLAERGHEVVVYAGSVDPRYGASRTIRIRRLPMPGPGALLRRVQLLLGSWLLVREQAHDVVVHMGRTGPGALWRAGGGCHRRWVELDRARKPKGWAKWGRILDPEQLLLLWHERRALLGGGRIVVPSARARSDLVDAYGPAAERVAVLPNGVDLERFHPKLRTLFFTEVRDELGLGPEEFVLLFVASDFWRKGLDRLFQALRVLAQGGDTLRLVVIGTARDGEHWRQAATEAGLRRQVMFLGKVPNPERVYAASDLLVMPTRFDAFANVTLEALAAGLPVVTTPENGAVDELPDTEAVAVVEDADDPATLAEAIRTMLDPRELPARREAARRAAEARGEVDAVARWELYLQEAARS
jgi:UDP-glucose:(heptosyl)LPS alpha-1,3-glucosyltransferase